MIRNTSEDKRYSDQENGMDEFVESVNKYCGFYIARYESSIFEKSDSDQPIAATMKNRMPWTNINYITAQEVALKSANGFGYEDCKTAIMNSYAWDTTLQWLDSSVENYSTNLSYGNYAGELFYTGTTVTDMINKICDLAGNMKDWTSEIYKEENNLMERRVVRGGSYKLSRTANSRTVYNPSETEINLGFRMILYRTVKDIGSP